MYGLSEDSRTKRLFNQSRFDLNTQLLIGIFDALNLILWSKSKDGAKNRNRPKQLMDILNNIQSDKVTAFSDGEEFEKAKARILERR